MGLSIARLSFGDASHKKHVVARPEAIDSYDLWENLCVLCPQKRLRRRAGLSRGPKTAQSDGDLVAVQHLQRPSA
jgi:hypothetical protein